MKIYQFEGTSNNATPRLLIGNGYIEGSELDNFLREFVMSIHDDEKVSYCYSRRKQKTKLIRPTANN